MQIQLKVKQAGKRKWILDNCPIDIDVKGNITTLEELISQIVRQQVNDYNAKIIEKQIVDFLTTGQIEAKAHTGKVGFGAIYHEGKADVKVAVKNALNAFIDGLYAVAINKKAISDLKEEIALKENDEMIFIKLTLLKG
jgi:hypothetical protein